MANFFPKKLLELDGFLKDPILNIHDLTQIHSDMNLPVPDPILLTNSHDGLDGPNMKKRKLEDREETFQGKSPHVPCVAACTLNQCSVPWGCEVA